MHCEALPESPKRKVKKKKKKKSVFGTSFPRGQWITMKVDDKINRLVSQCLAMFGNVWLNVYADIPTH